MIFLCKWVVFTFYVNFLRRRSFFQARFRRDEFCSGSNFCRCILSHRNPVIHQPCWDEMEQLRMPVMEETQLESYIYIYLSIYNIRILLQYI